MAKVGNGISYEDLKKIAEEPMRLCQITALINEAQGLSNVRIFSAPDYKSGSPKDAFYIGDVEDQSRLMPGYSLPKDGKVSAMPELKKIKRDFTNLRNYANRHIMNVNFVFFGPRYMQKNPEDEKELNNYFTDTMGDKLGITAPFKVDLEGKRLYLGYTVKDSKIVSFEKTIQFKPVWEPGTVQDIRKHEIEDPHLAYWKNVIGTDDITDDPPALDIYSRTVIIAWPRLDYFSEVAEGSRQIGFGMPDYPLWVSLENTARKDADAVGRDTMRPGAEREAIKAMELMNASKGTSRPSIWSRLFSSGDTVNNGRLEGGEDGESFRLRGTGSRTGSSISTSYKGKLGSERGPTE